MKVYKVELMIVDMDECGADEITCVIENQKYPNRCISPTVTNIQERDIGEWSDEHPLNHYDTMKSYFYNLFS